MVKDQAPSVKGSAVRGRAEDGTSITEMAFILPLLLVLTLGAVDFARAFYTGITLSNAAHAGVQYGHQTLGKTGDYTGMEQAADLDAQNLAEGIAVTSTRFCRCPSGGAVDCINGICSGSTPEAYVSVTATKTFNTLINYPGIPSTIAMSRTAIFRAQ